jgi:hypothetical protein
LTAFSSKTAALRQEFEHCTPVTKTRNESRAEGGASAATLMELPGMNHLLQEAKTGAPSEYKDIEETMSPPHRLAEHERSRTWPEKKWLGEHLSPFLRESLD